jgi:hypothetical protein
MSSAPRADTPRPLPAPPGAKPAVRAAARPRPAVGAALLAAASGVWVALATWPAEIFVTGW